MKKALKHMIEGLIRASKKRDKNSKKKWPFNLTTFFTKKSIHHHHPTKVFEC